MSSDSAEECPPAELLAELLDGTLAAAERAHLEQHVDACEACQQLLASLAPQRAGGPADALTASGPTGLLPEPLHAGQRVGRFDVLEPIGAGATALVYAANDRELGRRVALKFLRTETAADPGRRARMLREAQAMARLSHPAVLPVFEAGVHEGRIYIAMELVDGQTLRGWLARRRGWREILGVLADAGRGLAAAHAAGIIHRDFKPDNVLIGADGRVRVADFGLARMGPYGDEASGPVEGLGATPLTETGVVMGTPVYMAPELLAGGSGTVASDQYSFCVSLYEALYGERPFGGKDLRALRAAAMRESPPPVPRARRGVPRALHHALVRGLASRPAGRYPTLVALLAALHSGAAVPRRRALALGAALALAAGGLLWRQARPGRLSCPAAASQIATAWSPERRLALEASFLASGRPYAPTSFVSFARAVDRYTTRWAWAHEDACRATRVRDEQSEALLDRRWLCLAEQRQELASLLGVLERDPEGIDHAARAVSDLPRPERCEAAAVVRRQIAPPGEAIRPQVEALRLRLAEGRARHRVGQFLVVEPLAHELVADAQATRYLPLEAEALLFLAESETEVRAFERAGPHFEEAFQLAAASGDELTAARALMERAHLTDGAGERYRLAAAWIERLGDEKLQGDLAFALGKIAFEHGDLAGAHADFERALARYERVEPGGPGVGSIHNWLGHVHRASGELEEARRSYWRSLEIGRQASGPEHPLLAAVYNSLSLVVWDDVGDYSTAERLQRHALRLASQNRKGETHDAAIHMANLGGILIDAGNPAEGIALVERALAIHERTVGALHRQTANAHTILGAAFLDQGRLEESLAHLRQAEETQRHFKGDAHIDVALLEALRALALARLGRPDEAAALAAPAVANAERAFVGPNPLVALVQEIACLGALERRRFDEARELCTRAAANAEASLGRGHRDVAGALAGLALAELGRGDVRAAKAPAERALAILVPRTGDLALQLRAREAVVGVARAEGNLERAQALTDEMRGLRARQLARPE